MLFRKMLKFDSSHLRTLDTPMARKIRAMIFFMFIIFLNSGFSFDSGVWNKDGRGIYENDIRGIWIDPAKGARIYAGTSKALYRSSDRGKSYKSLLRPSGEQDGVNDIDIPMDQPGTIYAASDAGLYETLDDGKTWKRVYYSSDRESRQCLSVLRHDNVIYVGTRKGLFRKTDQETNWRMVKEDTDRKPVYHIVQDDHFIYFATGQTLLGLDKQTNAARTVFSMGVGERRGEHGAADQTVTAGEDQLIKFVAVSSPPRPHLFVASSRGIYMRSPHGEAWTRLPTSNLAVKELTSLLILESDAGGEHCLKEGSRRCLSLLAGTKKGVFFLNNKKWIPFYKGMETNQISYLAKDKRRAVYAATAKGIYFFPTEEALPSSHKAPGLQEARIGAHGPLGLPHEPDINEVHQLAIDYAEVNYEKIAHWRVLARKKALLPDLSVGLDRNASDLFHWNTGANPDELQKGRDYIDWDVSMSWDLGDLVWSTDQTTIDSRSKLMVELREDILDEVTRLYFERRRIQTELVLDHLPDPRSKIDKEMRVSELTALIDALTGGEFSKRIMKEQ